MWLAAENGIFVRHTSGEWVTKIPEHMNLEWTDGVKVSTYISELKIDKLYFTLLNLLWLICLQHVFKYFTERTPGSYFETSEASLVWNYEYAGD